MKKRLADDANVALSDGARRTWCRADEQRLSEMKTAGASVAEIAAAVNRTEAAVENRLHVSIELQQREGPPQASSTSHNV